MSLARRRRRAAESVVDAVPSPPSDGPQLSDAPPQPSDGGTSPEPLGAPAAGSAEARRRLLADTASSDADVATDSDGETPRAPREEGANQRGRMAVSLEDAAAILAGAIDTAGQILGPLATQRRDVPWALSEPERQTVQRAAVPVCRQYLTDVELSPLGALAVVLVSVYAPRVVMAVSAPASPEATAPPEPASSAPSTAPSTATAPREERHGW